VRSERQAAQRPDTTACRLLARHLVEAFASLEKQKKAFFISNYQIEITLINCKTDKSKKSKTTEN